MAQGLHVPALGLNTIIFKYVYWYMKQISGERLQDHWSSGLDLRRRKWNCIFCLAKNKGGVCVCVAGWVGLNIKI